VIGSRTVASESLVTRPIRLRRPDLPLVTVVTPSYNQGRFIRATIESVLAQDYPNIEYIVVDGLSNDETAAVCGEYADRLTFISEKDRGQSHAINKGFRMARGEIVAWLNSDDIFLPGAIDRVVEAFLSEPELGAVYGEGYQIDIDGKVKQRFSVTEPFNLWKLVYLSDYILQQTVFFRRDAFDEVGLLDESLHYGMDWEILMRLGKRFMLRYLPFYMGSIREYGEAKTSTGGARRFRELVKIMRHHGRSAFPPGFIVYGLETYQRILNERIEAVLRGPFEPLGRRVRAGLGYWCNRIVHRAIRESQGLYADGWAAPRLRYMLPPGNGRFLELKLSLPAGMLPRQTVAVEVNGRRLARRTFEPGEYTLPVRLPEALWHRTLEMTLEATHHYRPAPAGGAQDRRKLCYIVRGIGYSRQAATPRAKRG
jgi:glycosyltransferase involved in cell wall biosynthesis